MPVTTTPIVCPNCGSDRIGTIEEAHIWQPCSFTLYPEAGGPKPVGFTSLDGRTLEPEWDAYDSDDVGDTETVGFFCKGCTSSWYTDDVLHIPFVTRAEFEHAHLERGSLEFRCRDIGYGVEEGSGEYLRLTVKDWTGKTEYRPAHGGHTIYLFDDEIVSWELVA